MDLAVTVWNGRIAPVFDVAGHFLILSPEREERLIAMESGSPDERIRQLETLRVDTLICGAISRCAMLMAQQAGIRVCSFIAGDVAEVLDAWHKSQLLDNPRFTMPGCGHGNNFRGRCRLGVGCGKRRRVGESHA